MYQGISKFLVIASMSLALLACATTNVLEKQIRGEGGQKRRSHARSLGNPRPVKTLESIARSPPGRSGAVGRGCAP